MKRVSADHSRSATLDGRSAGWRRRQCALAAGSFRPNDLDGICCAAAGPPHCDRVATPAGQRTTQGGCRGVPEPGRSSPRPRGVRIIRAGCAIVTLLASCLAMPAVARAYDADETFARGTWIAGVLLGGGKDFQLQAFEPSGVSFVNLLPRVSILPWAPFGSSWWKGALELGLEGWLQYHTEPAGPTAFGLKAAARYHFVGLGRLVPYVEVLAGLGGTSLNVKEIDSNFTFVTEAGAGLAYMVADRIAISAGYRFYHLSNGGIDDPNLGINAHEAVAGVSFFWR
jgi:lipid A 3-O-deacylase